MGMGRICYGLGTGLCCRYPSGAGVVILRPFWCNIIKTSILIFVYYLLSIGLTFYQNFLLKKIHFPLSVVLCHLVIKFLLASGLRLGYECIYGIPRVFLDCEVWVKRLSLVGVSGGLDIAFSNWGTMLISVSLYTMTKSTAIIFILVFALILKLEEKHWSLVLIVGMISGGLFMFTYKSTQFELTGFLLILCASFLSGLRWSMAQLITQKSKLGLHNPIDMIFHFQPFMILAVLPFALYFEGIALTNFNMTIESDEEKRLFYKSLYAILVGGLMAFFMEIAEYLLVVHTSSLTLSVAGCFKELCTLCLAVIFNHDPLTPLNVLGLILCFIGITGHVGFKFSKSAKEAEEPGRGNQIIINANGGSTNNRNKLGEVHLKETNILRPDDDMPLLLNTDSDAIHLLDSSDDEEVWSKR